MRFKTFFDRVNKITNFAIGVAVLGMLITFGALRLTNPTNQITADVEPPELRINPSLTTVPAGQTVDLSVEFRGFKPTEISWLTNDARVTLSPATGTVTQVRIPKDLKGQTITITAQANLGPSSKIQTSTEIAIE